MRSMSRANVVPGTAKAECFSARLTSDQSRSHFPQSIVTRKRPDYICFYDTLSSSGHEVLAVFLEYMDLPLTRGDDSHYFAVDVEEITTLSSNQFSCLFNFHPPAK